MTAQLHHIALLSDEFEETVRFFEEVFSMEVSRTEGQAPERKLWFRQGIQINEAQGFERRDGQYHHIGMSVSSVPETVERAKEFGCTTLPGKDKWLVTKDGLIIELIV